MNIHRYHARLLGLCYAAETIEATIETLRRDIDATNDHPDALDLLEDATLLTVAAGLLRQVTKTFEEVERGAGRRVEGAARSEAKL